MASQKRNTKEEILKVSARLFAERGYEKTSTRDIAKELSIASPSLYYHFKSKSEILLELLYQPMEYIESELGGIHNLSKPQQLRKILDVLITSLEYHNGIVVVASEYINELDKKKIIDFEARTFGQIIQNIDGNNKELRINMTIGAIERVVKDLNSTHRAEFTEKLKMIKSELIDISMKILED